MNVFLVENNRNFIEIKDAWNRLLLSNKNLNKFQSWEFNYSWWNTFSKLEKLKLKIFCFGTKKDLKIILPCYVDQNKCLKFLQDGFIDFPEIIYEEKINLLPLLKKIVDAINKDNDINCIVLNNLKDKSPIVKFFPYLFKKNSFFLFQSNQYSVIKKEYYDDKKILSHLPAKQRNELKKINKTIKINHKFLKKEFNEFPEEIINKLLKNLIKHNNRNYETFKKIVLFLKDLYNKHLIYFICHEIGDEIVSLSAMVDLSSTEKLIWIDFYNPKIKKINLKNYIVLLNYTKNETNLNLGTGNHDYKIKNFFPEIFSLYTFYLHKNKILFSYKMLKKIVAKALGYF